MSDETAEPLLSSDETEALLAAMRNGASSSQTAKELTLGSTDQRLRETLERADAVGREFALELRKLLRRTVGIPLTVREGTADVVPFNVLASTAAPGSAIGTLKIAGSVVGFIILGPRITVRVLSRRLGAGVPAADAPEEETRAMLSPVDRRISRPFLLETLESFNQYWSKGELLLELGDVLAKPADLPRLPQFEPMLRLPLSIGVSPEQSEELSFVLTASALPPVTGEKEEASSTEQTQVSSVERARLAARLSHAEVEVVAVLGHAMSTVREVLRLNVGDVIRLNEPPDTPVKVSIEGRQKMIGVPVVRHGNLAIEVTQVLKGAP